MPTTYVTTSIPYVNAQPHIGHALEMVQADVIARLHRQAGNRTILQTGTDENAFKNVLAAKKAGIPTQEFVDRNAADFANLVKRLNVSADTFIRTTEERHRLGVYKFWNSLDPQDLYIKEYAGLYCDGCEDFYVEKDLVGGLCADHQTAPRPVSEKNVFFKLSRYQDVLRDAVTNNRIRIYPESRKAEILGFLDRGLADISVSRAAERAGGWGIPVPGHPDQVIYVWIDALVNYLTGQGYGTSDAWREIWDVGVRKIHVIGKNISKFHVLYWPALLISAGLPMPDEVFVHGFLTQNNQKISKSLGNAIHPNTLIDTYGCDGLRHFLTKHIPALGDGDFSLDRVKAAYNADLANGLGNLLNRVRTLAAKAELQLPPVPPPTIYQSVEKVIGHYQLEKGISACWEEVSRLNREVEQQKPWEDLAGGRILQLQPKLLLWNDAIENLANNFTAYLPETAAKILKREPGILFPKIK